MNITVARSQFPRMASTMVTRFAKMRESDGEVMDEVPREYSRDDDRGLHYVCVIRKGEKRAHFLCGVPGTGSGLFAPSPAADCDTLYGFRNHTVR